jgi:hypothetical protein
MPEDAPRTKLKKIFSFALCAAAFVLVCGLVVIAAAFIIQASFPRAAHMTIGANFSERYAKDLGVDWKQAYLAMFDDLGIREIRLPAYWDEIEPSRGTYDFSDLDWQIDAASQRGVKVILAAGFKLPRWPECYEPTWASKLSVADADRARLAMIAAVVRHFQGQSAVVEWQIENEPLLPFGDCGTPDTSLIKEEVAEAHALDSRPVLTQDAGEFSTWQPTAQLGANVLGVSLYRFVAYKQSGYVRWPEFAAIYRLRGALALRYVRQVILTEMQAEPWFTKPLTDVPIADQLAQMNPKVLAENIDYAKRIGFSDDYLWGVEWWYWLKQHGHPEMWSAGKQIVVASQKGAIAAGPEQVAHP